MPTYVDSENWFKLNFIIEVINERYLEMVSA